MTPERPQSVRDRLADIETLRLFRDDAARRCDESIPGSYDIYVRADILYAEALRTPDTSALREQERR